MNPRTDNDPIVGKLYRVTDPNLAVFAKLEKEKWEIERDWKELYKKLLASKCILLLKINFSIELEGKFLLEDKVYDFWIPISKTDRTCQETWDTFFELLH